MKILLISMVLFISTNHLYAKSKDFPIGKVKIAKGEVTVLQPHALKAVSLKKGDFVYEDSSILSSEKSFAKIKFINDSYITIGPKSKVVVNLVKKKGASVIGLLQGMVRSTVNKKEDKHFFVKTRNAALGVRGTDFMTTFNSESHKTSLLTYSGSVAIKKIEKKLGISNKLSIEEKIDVVSKMQKFLTEKPVIAKTGQFTNISVLNSTPEPVVKINVKQLVRLKLDTTLGVNKLKISKIIIKKEEMRITKEMLEIAEKEPEKEKNTEIKKSVQGGLIDVETGLYIPPAEKGKAVGKLLSNGKYVPPKGLKLDAHKGFIALNNKNEEVAEKLNEKLSDQVTPDPENPAYRRYFDTE